MMLAEKPVWREPTRSRLSAHRRNKLVSACPLLTVRGLSKHFALRTGNPFQRRQPVQAVDRISFELLGGETLAVVGESGCGKSTTAQLIMALQQPTAGEIIFDGELISRRRGVLKDYRRQVQMVFQDSYASLNPRMSIENSIAYGPRVHGLDQASATRRAHELMAAVGLAPQQFGGRFPHELSGGQRQRVNIARALALRPRLLILDEPVSALDKSVEAQVLNLLMDLKRRFGLTYLFISHDLNVVQHVADRVLVMYLGNIIESGPAEQVFETPAHPYTKALLASRLSLNPERRRTEPPLSGDPPNPSAPPSGCRFRTRCTHAEPVCADTVPPPVAVSGPGTSAHLAACLIMLPGSGHSQAPRTAA